MTDYSRYQFIKVEKADKIATLTLNRPETFNAVFDTEHYEIEDIFQDVDRDDEVGAVIITGAGRAFSSGGDIKRMLAEVEKDPLQSLPPSSPKRLFRNLLELRKPIVAAVNGDAMGLGATIALSCDYIIIAETARLADPHIKMGIVPGDGGCVIWPLLTSFCRAKEYLMLGDMIRAADAERLGLVNRVVPAEAVMPEARKVAARFASSPPQALVWTKMCLNKVLLERFNLLMDAGLSYEYHSLRVADHKEAVHAFAERRPPKYQGGPL